MARYLNLPRVELMTSDGNLVINPGAPLTESVLIIAPALDGPNDRVLQVNNLKAIEQIYGPMSLGGEYLGPNGEVSGYSGNALIKAVREVFLGGAADIRVLRVGGTKSTATLTSTGPVTGTLTLTALNAGRLYNQVRVSIVSGATSGRVLIEQPAVKGGDFEISLTGTLSGLTVRQLVDRINSDNRNQTVKVALGTASSTGLARSLSGTVTLSGGTDGTVLDDLATNKIALYNSLTASETGTFALLEDYECDIVLLAGVYLDDLVVSADATKTVATPFTDFLAERSLDHPMIGVLGVRPLDDASTRAAINTHYAALTTTNSGFRDTASTWTNAGYFMNRGFEYSDGDLGQPIDSGAYLQVVAADVILNDRDLGLYVDSAAGLYAGTLSRLKPHDPATHKPVNGLFHIPYQFTKAQLDYLVGGMGRNVNAGVAGKSAYVTLREMTGRGILFTRDVTASSRESDFKDLQPLRIVNAAHKGIKDIAFDFLGQPNDIAHRQALHTRIKSFLDAMYESGALLGRDGIGYTLEILGGNDAVSQLLGILEINVTLRPALQIKAIKVRIRLSL